MEIDITGIQALMNLPPDQLIWQIFITIGWLPIFLVFLKGSYMAWNEYITGKWGAQQKYTLLAIDIPSNNEQSPKAVENMFMYLAGAHTTLNLIEQYWDGKFQQAFSLEIVSIDGYTQFLIRTPSQLRNMVESGLYSVYPDAEITEVNDYTAGVPHRYPDPEWELWGCEFHQTDHVSVPIRTHDKFVESNWGKPELTFKDPIGPLMDLCSSLKRGEQLWFQLIIRPAPPSWPKDYKADDAVKKLLGEKPSASKPGMIANIFESLFGFFEESFAQLFGINLSGAPKKEEKKEEMFKMMNLKPIERRKLEAIHDKISKTGFDTKIRLVYVAKKEVMNKPKVANGFIGWMKHFADLGLNGFKPDTKITGVSAHYFFKQSILNERKNKLIRSYIWRSGWRGLKWGFLTVDEIATLWHFPVFTSVKAPLIQSAPGRKAMAPSTLPIEMDMRDPAIESLFMNETRPSQAPASLPFEDNTTPFEEKGGNEPVNKGGAPGNLPFA